MYSNFGIQWSLIPNYYGKNSTVHGKFRQWAISGCFEKILQTSIDLAIKKSVPQNVLSAIPHHLRHHLLILVEKILPIKLKNGIKKGVVIDTNSIILSVLVDSANKHYSKLLLPHVQNVKEYVNKPKVMIADSAWGIKKFIKI